MNKVKFGTKIMTSKENDHQKLQPPIIVPVFEGAVARSRADTYDRYSYICTRTVHRRYHAIFTTNGSRGGKEVTSYIGR